MPSRSTTPSLSLQSRFLLSCCIIDSSLPLQNTFGLDGGSIWSTSFATTSPYSRVCLAYVNLFRSCGSSHLNLVLAHTTQRLPISHSRCSMVSEICASCRYQYLWYGMYKCRQGEGLFYLECSCSVHCKYFLSFYKVIV